MDSHSQHTISINEEVRKEKAKKEKPKKDNKLKLKKHDTEYKEQKISGLRSADKFAKKKEPKEVVSPRFIPPK